jgi:hypothetical protein
MGSPKTTCRLRSRGRVDPPPPAGHHALCWASCQYPHPPPSDSERNTAKRLQLQQMRWSKYPVALPACAAAAAAFRQVQQLAEAGQHAEVGWGAWALGGSRTGACLWERSQLRRRLQGSLHDCRVFAFLGGLHNKSRRPGCVGSRTMTQEADGAGIAILRSLWEARTSHMQGHTSVWACAATSSPQASSLPSLQGQSH